MSRPPATILADAPQPPGLSATQTARREAEDLRRALTDLERFVGHLRQRLEQAEHAFRNERRHAMEAHTLAATQADEFRKVIDSLATALDRDAVSAKRPKPG